MTALGLPSGLSAAGAPATLRLADYFRILERLSIAAHDETCRLSTRPLLPGSTHFVLSNLAPSADLFDAMKRIAKAYNILHGGSYNHVEHRGASIAYIIDDRDFPYASREDEGHICFTMECVLIFLHSTLALITSDSLHGALHKVYTKREARTEHAGHLDFWDAPIRFKAPSYALIYEARANTLPIRITPDDLPPPQAVYRKIIDLIDARERVEARRPRTAERVVDRLRRGIASQHDVACKLGMSVATLRRRLSAEGTSFRALRQQCLNEAAKALLRQGHRIAEVADELGFSDFRSFTRAFKTWNGVSPSAYTLRPRPPQAKTNEMSGPNHGRRPGRPHHADP
ncbi:MAG: helix-turn-helix domain-containing protein [Pseudomonadota bacterium]